MTTLVTGSDGLVGSALKLLDTEDFVFVGRKDADLTNFDSTISLFEKYKPSRVIHLAAVVGGVGSNTQHSGMYFRDNILINTNVLEAARLSGVNKLISFMSTCVFPDKVQFPLKVEDLHNGPPHPSNFGYAYSKRMLEVQSRAYRDNWGCNYIIAIPSNIYGPHDNFSLTDGHVLPALINRAYMAKKEGTDLLVWGSGAPLREFIYSLDVADIILQLLDQYDDANPIIISSGIETSIKEAVNLVVELLEFDGRVIFDATKPDGQYRKPSDIKNFQKLLPDFQWTDLSEGLKGTIEWFILNHALARK